MEDSQCSHEDLSALFSRARRKLMEDFGKEGDPLDSLSRYHANTERGVAEGRVIWEDIMTRHGREAQYWLDYIAYIRHREGAESVRKLFQLAVNSASDAPVRVCEAFLQFEREEGTLESFEGALTRTAAQLERVRERQEKAAEKEAQQKEELKRKRKSEKKGAQKSSSHAVSEGAPRSQQQGQRSQRKRTAARVFRDSDDDDEESMAKKPKVEGKIPHEPESNGGVATEVAMETERIAEPEGPTEKRTVFVMNLPPEVTEDSLRERFSECGEVFEVRIIRSRKTNRLNTYAYVEFTSPAPVSHALSLDRTMFMEKQIMYVSPFVDKSQKKQTPNERRQENKCTVFVKNLQKDVQEKKLEELFQQCGEVKEVRIVRNVAGRSKGYAYVEFKDELSAQDAVKKLDSHLLGLKRLTVAISNPPSSSSSRQYQQQQDPNTTSPVAIAVAAVTAAAAEGGGVAGGGTKRDAEGFARPTFIPRRAQASHQPSDVPQTKKSRTSISLMPRVLAKKGGVDKDKGQDLQEPERNKMSNDDFRKLFSK